jgi:hypothetical protein
MKASLSLLLTALIGVLSGLSLGCGTVCNLAGGITHPESEPRIYGGFIRDIEIIESAVNAPSPQRVENVGDGKGAAILVLAIISVAAVDPLLSLAADTLTLPITIPLQERRISLRQEAN